MGFPSPPPQQPQPPLLSVMPEQQLGVLSSACDCAFILAQHGQEDIDMPSFMVCQLDEAAIGVVQAERASVANATRIGRDAHIVDPVIKISFVSLI